MWNLYSWSNVNTAPTQVQVPNEISRAAAGCFVYLNGGMLCTGASSPINVNGSWFYVGGSSETHGASGTVNQPAQAAIWNLSANGFASTNLNFGNAKYVSGIWPSHGNVLIATSDTPNDPFAANRYWLFDGSSLQNLSSSFAVGGLSQADARDIHAAYNGKSWMLLYGKKQFRFDGTTFTALEDTRDAFETVTSNGSGLFVAAGAVSDGAHAFATSPLTAQLSVATEDLSAHAVVPMVSGNIGDIVRQFTVEEVVFPAHVAWTHHAASGIDWASWTDAKDNTLLTGDVMKYSVTAYDRAGIRAIHILVNGVEKRVCDGKRFDSASCSVALAGADYGYGTEVFMNAEVINTKGKYVWIDATRIHRDTAAAGATTNNQPSTSNHQPSADNQTITNNPSTANQIFSTTLTIDPDASTVERGTILHVHNSSQNNTVGLTKAELYLNGNVIRECLFGPVMSAVGCDANVDTSAYPAGTGLSFASRAEDYLGHAIWSNAKAMNVTDPGTLVDQAAPNTSGINAWTWFAPAVTELSEGQTASYGVGAWSPAGIDRIEIIVDGSVRRACLATSSGNTECAYTISTNDYSHGHIAVVNARITDMAHHITWSAPRAVLIKRTWTPLPSANAYVTVVPNQTAYHLGETITLKANAWAPNGVNRIDIFSQGVKVASCSSDVCAWTSPQIFTNTFEYQAHLTDGLNQESWTGVMGMQKQ